MIDATTAVLELHGFNAFIRGVPLLRDIDFSINSGEIVALIGPNGAGKSSLLRAMVGDVAGDTGGVNIGGEALAFYSPAELARQRAYLPQANELNFPFEGLDVVMMGRMPHSSGNQIDTRIAQDALAAMDVSHLAQRLYTQLSGGERQRIHLARVMAQIWRSEDSDRRLLILDEPCASLDIAHTQMLMHALKQLASNGVAIIMVLHDFTLAARYAQRIAAMSCGAIVEQGAPAEVITKNNLRRLFNVEASILQHPDIGYPVVCIND